jgi:hypothetical protein
VAETPTLRLLCCGVSPQLLEQVVRSRQLPVQRVEQVEEADAVLSLRQQLGRDPGLRREALERHVPILVIKADTLPQIQRGVERLLHRRPSASSPGSAGAPPAPDDAHAAMEECRLAVEQVVLPQGRPVELLPRSLSVRRIQADQVNRYGLRSAEFGSGDQQRLRVFPP